VGTTAQRPLSPQANYLRYNTTINAIERYNGSSWEDLFFRPVVATGGTVTDITLSGKLYRRHVYSYTGSTQTFSISNQGSFSEIIVKVWGAAGGAGTSYFSTQGGPGGYGSAIVNIRGISSISVVVGQGGRTSAGERSTYGHLLNSTDGRAGGFGAACGDGGGLSGIFNGAADNQANAIFIAAGGGGSGQVNTFQLEGAGGAGGGPGQPGDDGWDNQDSTDGNGRGAPVVYGGPTGLRFYVSPNGRGSVSLATSGSALCGGHADTASNWTEGGGGGSGYWGGGSGAHELTGGYWSTAGGGCGYIDEARCSNVIAASGTYQLMSTIASSDPDYVSGIGVPANGTTGGNGRVVILYPLENPYL
jgi:hypothetical protein